MMRTKGFTFFERWGYSEGSFANPTLWALLALSYTALHFLDLATARTSKVCLV